MIIRIILIICNYSYFIRLAEARSNPHLLDIGELSRNDVKGEVKQYMLGDRSADDLARSKSHDDLLFL